MLPDRLSTYEHPAWRTTVVTLVGWGIILLIMFLLLFALPYGIVVAL